MTIRQRIKVQTSVAENQYQELNKFDEEEPVVVKIEEPVAIKKEKLEITSGPKIVYNNKHTFSKYKNFRKYLNCSFQGAVTNMRYFARSKFSRSLVHKRNFSLI